jgi:hypothetical protein
MLSTALQTSIRTNSVHDNTKRPEIAWDICLEMKEPQTVNRGYQIVVRLKVLAADRISWAMTFVLSVVIIQLEKRLALYMRSVK